MQIKMSQVLNMIPIYQKVKGQSLPVKTTYKFSKLFNALDRESKFYGEELNKLIDQYSEKDENGAPVTLEDGTGIQLQKVSVDIVNARCNELWNLEVDIPDINFELTELETLSLTVEEFNLLLPFIAD